MSYNILPKKNFDSNCFVNSDYNNNNIIIKTELYDNISQIISFSLTNYLEISNNQTKNIPIQLKNIINPYSFLYINIPSTGTEISKLNSDNENFYSFIEIVNTFNILDNYTNKPINILYCCNEKSGISYINNIRKIYNDNKYELKSLLEFEFIHDTNDAFVNIDFGYFEMTINDELNEINHNNYIIQFIHVLCYITLYQNTKGVSIIKIDVLYHKPILDILYLLTGMFEYVYIIKPNTSCIFNNDRYIVCKQFIKPIYNPFLILKSIKTCIKKGDIISSFLNIELPCIFLSKVEDSNVITGQMQLEYFNQLISISKNKNADDKLEVIKKANIQKCVLWCEKMKVPYNKLVDKLNIFLPIVNE